MQLTETGIEGSEAHIPPILFLAALRPHCGPPRVPASWFKKELHNSGFYLVCTKLTQEVISEITTFLGPIRGLRLQGNNLKLRREAALSLTPQERLNEGLGFSVAEPKREEGRTAMEQVS